MAGLARQVSDRPQHAARDDDVTHIDRSANSPEDAADADCLARVVAELREIASPDQRDRADVLLARASARRLRVLVAGEANRGKSTLLNRLLDRDALPSGVLPLTAVVTTIWAATGGAEHLTVRFLDGHSESRPLSDLSELVTESGNPHNEQNIAEVDVALTGGPMARYPVELVDTPGTGSVFAHNTDVAHHAYSSLDAVIVVLTADPPISAADRDLLDTVSSSAVQTFVVVNKADQLAAEELDASAAFTRTVCTQVGIEPDRVWVISARLADAGFWAFRGAFETYLAAQAAADTEQALRRHALHLADAITDDVSLTVRAIEMSGQQQHDALRTFTDGLSVLELRAAELEDRCQLTQRRLLRSLDSSARNQDGPVRARCRAAIAAAVAALPPDLPVGEREEDARRALVRTAVDSVESWRREQAGQIQRALQDLAAAVTADSERDLTTIRDAARDLLDVTLRAPTEHVMLQQQRPFWYALERPVGWEPPGADLLRRHGPGAARRADARILGEVGQFVDRQIGRARADLQHRLSETVRELLADLRLGHGDIVTGLRAALDHASQLGAMESSDNQQRLDDLHRRRRQLNRIIDTLSW